VYQKTQIVTQLVGLSAPNWDATIPALGVGSDSYYGYLDLSPLRCCCCDPGATTAETGVGSEVRRHLQIPAELWS